MKISVFITSYNQKHLLIEAIDSVLAQTLKPHQIIIVDDFSQDGSQEVIAGYASRYPELIRAIYHPQNMGVTQSRIDALHAVRGDYVTYVDGDDRFLPTKLEKEAASLQKNRNADIAFSDYFYMTHDGETRLHHWLRDGIDPPEGDVFLQTFARRFPRRNIFRMELVNYKMWQSVGFHDPHLSVFEDYDMRIRLTEQLTVTYCPEPLSEVRINDDGLSKSSNMLKADAVHYILKKNEALLDKYPKAIRQASLNDIGEWKSYFEKGAIAEHHSLAQSLVYFWRASRYHSFRKNISLLSQIMKASFLQRGLLDDN